jgi:hypothetical protein
MTTCSIQYSLSNKKGGRYNRGVDIESCYDCIGHPVLLSMCLQRAGIGHQPVGSTIWTTSTTIGTSISLCVLWQRCDTKDARSECCTWGVAHNEKGNNKVGEIMTRRPSDKEGSWCRRLDSRWGGWSMKSNFLNEAFLDKEWHRRSGSREVVLGFDWGSSWKNRHCWVISKFKFSMRIDVNTKVFPWSHTHGGT